MGEIIFERPVWIEAAAEMDTFGRMGFTAVFEPAQEGGYTCFVKEVPAAISEGETLEEAKANLEEALQLVLETQPAEMKPAIAEVPAGEKSAFLREVQMLEILQCARESSDERVRALEQFVRGEIVAETGAGSYQKANEGGESVAGTGIQLEHLPLH